MAWFNKRLGRWMVRTSDGRDTYRYRLIMEQHLGRRLASDEYVHHINGDSTDDRLENLEVMSASDHTTHHLPDMLPAQKPCGWSRFHTECVECGTTAREHVGHGKCSRCYFRQKAREYRAARKQAEAVAA